MKQLLCLALVAIVAALAHEPAGGVAPLRKPHVDELPKGFINSLGMKFAWIPPGSFIMGQPQGGADSRGRRLGNAAQGHPHQGLLHGRLPRHPGGMASRHGVQDLI